MRTLRLFLATMIAALAGTSANASPQEPAKAPTALEILEKAEQVFYYAGGDMKAKVNMDLITESGKKRSLALTMLRKNDSKTRDQKYFMYFHEPGDVRRTAFLVWKYPEKDDDRWVFIPAVNAVRRVAASDSRSSFVGSDFTYEDLSGRDLPADTHSLVKEEKLGDSDCFVVQSVPKSAAEYTKKLAWIDKKTFLPRKEEYYDAQNELARVFTAEAIEDIAVGEGAAKKVVPTVTKRSMKNVKSGHRTEVRFTTIAYDVGLEDDVFTERALQNAPQKWIR
jgi:outer membrane lipoprotein-sorting protein